MAGTKPRKSDRLLLVIVSGLALGGLYGMTALVYNVMYSTSKVLSFGTGQFAMAGGICGAFLVLNLHWPMWIGFAACLVSGAVFGWLSEIIAVRRIVAVSDEHLWVLSTLALSTMVQEAMGLWWGTDPTPFPRVFPQEFAGAFDQKFWLPIVTAIAMALGLELFYRRTMLGKLFIAISEDAFAARARGIATDHMRAVSYVIAGVLGAHVRLRRRPAHLCRLRARHDARPLRLHRARAGRHRQQPRRRHRRGDPRTDDVVHHALSSARSIRRPSPSACSSACWWCDRRACSAPSACATYDPQRCCWHCSPRSLARGCRSRPPISITCTSRP